MDRNIVTLNCPCGQTYAVVVSKNVQPHCPKCLKPANPKTITALAEMMDCVAASYVTRRVARDRI